MWSGTPRACTACELVQRGQPLCSGLRCRTGEAAPFIRRTLAPFFQHTAYELAIPPSRYPVNTGLVSDAGLPRVASVRHALPEVGRHEARGFVGLFECCWHQALRPRVEGEVLRFLPGVA